MKFFYTKISRGIKDTTDKRSIWARKKIVTLGSKLNEDFWKSHGVSNVIKKLSSMEINC